MAVSKPERLHQGLAVNEAKLIVESLYVNRQKTNGSESLKDAYRLDRPQQSKGDIEGGGQNTQSCMIELCRYRGKATSLKRHVDQPDDELLILLRKLAPGADDGHLLGVIERVADAWRLAWSVSAD